MTRKKQDESHHKGRAQAHFHVHVPTGLAAAVLISACATSTKEELPAVLNSGLVPVKGTQADAV